MVGKVRKEEGRVHRENKEQSSRSTQTSRRKESNGWSESTRRIP